MQDEIILEVVNTIEPMAKRRQKKNFRTLTLKSISFLQFIMIYFIYIIALKMLLHKVDWKVILNLNNDN